MKILFAIGLILAALQALPGHAAAAALVLPADGRPVSASGHLQMLRDTTGQLGPDAALAASGWRPLPGPVSAGYTPDAIWLRLDVARATQSPDEWVLRFSNAVLDDVSLYCSNQASPWVMQPARTDVLNDAAPNGACAR